VEIIKSIEDAYQELATAVPRYTGDDHLNQLDVLQYPECNPIETYWTDYFEQFRICLTL